MRKLVLFDIDGTLLNSDGAGRTAVHAAFREQLDLPYDPGVPFDGKTDPQIIRELFAVAGRADADLDAAISAVCSRYLELLAAELAGGTHAIRLLPGIPALLDALEGRAEALLGLLTGNLIDGARLKIGAAGLRFERFRVGAYGSDNADRGALPAIAAERARPLMGRRPHGTEVVILGDTPADMICGRGIGARSIGVATGRYAPDQLRDAGAWRVFESLADTEAVLEAVLA